MVKELKMLLDIFTILDFGEKQHINYFAIPLNRKIFTMLIIPPRFLQMGNRNA
jgi:hypothetical protein